MQTDPRKMKLRKATLDWRYYFYRTDARPSVESPFWKALIDCHADDKVTHLFADSYYPSRLSTFNYLTPYTLLKAIQDYPARPGSDLERVQNLWRNFRKLDYELVDVEQIRKEHGVCLTTGAASTDIDRIRRIAGIYRDLSRLIDEPNEYSQLAIDLDGIAKKMEVSLGGGDKSVELFNVLRKGKTLERTLKTNSRLARLALRFDEEEFRCSHPQLDIVLDCYRTAYIRGNSPQCAEKMAAVFFVNNGRFRANGANESVAYSIRDALFKAVDKQVIAAVPLFLEVALFGAKVGGASIEADFQAIVKAEPIIAAMMYDDVLDEDILVLKIKIACAMAKIFMDTTLYSSARCEQKWGMSILLDRAKSILWLNHAKQLLKRAGNNEAEPFLRKSFEKELDDEIQFLEKFVAGGMESKLGSFSANEYDSKSSIAIMCAKIEAEMKETKDRLTFFPHVLLEDKMADLAISTDTNALLLKMAINEDVHNLVSDLLCLRETLMKMEPESKVAIGIVCRPEQYETILESVGEDIETNDLHVLKLGELKNDITKVFVDFGDLLDAVEAAKKCRIAAENGDKRAQCEMGSRYKEGDGVEKDFVQAVTWYRKSAEQGYSVAQYDLGVMYENGWGVEKDAAKAVEWYGKAAEQGHAAAQWALGVMYGNGWGVEKDLAESAGWFRKAAEQGHAAAQYYLGLDYKKGLGVEADDAEAVRWYSAAAENGEERAQREMGWRCQNGDGVEKDIAKAVEWYRKSAEQGYAVAQCDMGVMYGNGWGVEENATESADWFRKAAEQGHAAAQYYLGLHYAKGWGVDKDDGEAAKWYRKAAEHEYADAQYNLGWNYENGCGVRKNKKMAIKWYRKAAEQGHENAKKALDRLTK